MRLWHEPLDDPESMSPEQRARYLPYFRLADKTFEHVARSESSVAYMARALPDVLRLAGWEAGAIYLWDDAGDELVLAHHHGVDEGQAKDLGTLGARGSRLVEAVGFDRAFFLDRGGEIGESAPLLAEAGWSRLLVVPMYHGESRVGALGVLARPSQDGAAGADVLAAAASIVGMCVQRYRISESEHARALSQSERWQALYETAVDMTRHLGRDDLLQRIVDRCGNLLRSSDAWLMLYDEEAGDLVIEVERRITGPVSSVGHRVDLGRGVVAQAFASGRPVGVDDYPTWPSHRPDAAAYAFQSVAAAPVFDGERRLGVLVVAETALGFRYDEDSLQTLFLLAQQAAVVLQQDRAMRQAESIAMSEERDRIAGDLHDGLAQELASLLLRAELTRSLCEDTCLELAGGLDDLCTGLQRAIRDTRATIYALRTSRPTGADMHDALQVMSATFASQTGADVTLDVRGNRPSDVPPDYQFAVLRVVHEALTNAHKHAQASVVTIRVEHAGAGALIVTVTDDGAGFDPDSVGGVSQLQFGLNTMREQVEKLGGTFAVESSPGCGTRLVATLPPRRA